ncbi:hypothetical protein ADUPG1_009681 [Aduncisulcus paluster]|uniref:Uncharacterized protein n=1 Tax=Aduncisulcus paluster TaxID=2918883 RepID=A0ABQ5KWG0_9EUKA|nr:hypothetical protein ADUPG1_009681 [Aduncisulcus paluster]|eukprot:gnl/Carplike_NY0171/3709_a5007_450.p1 GENE.gnl/Carplike_NY0171/3709_a5007_450~~gnl/Carplike_NY0171/3709_a5007_450.p1  ORF type:complete len:406 (-),score=63.30 gnl/Carplike_NY0171/3709_a5007_450:124-1341(-)
MVKRTLSLFFITLSYLLVFVLSANTCSSNPLLSDENTFSFPVYSESGSAYVASAFGEQLNSKLFSQINHVSSVCEELNFFEGCCSTVTFNYMRQAYSSLRDYLEYDLNQIEILASDPYALQTLSESIASYLTARCVDSGESESDCSTFVNSAIDPHTSYLIESGSILKECIHSVESYLSGALCALCLEDLSYLTSSRLSAHNSYMTDITGACAPLLVSLQTHWGASGVMQAAADSSGVGSDYVQSELTSINSKRTSFSTKIQDGELVGGLNILPVWSYFAVYFGTGTRPDGDVEDISLDSDVLTTVFVTSDSSLPISWAQKSSINPLYYLDEISYTIWIVILIIVFIVCLVLGLILCHSKSGLASDSEVTKNELERRHQKWEHLKLMKKQKKQHQRDIKRERKME